MKEVLEEEVKWPKVCEINKTLKKFKKEFLIEKYEEEPEVTKRYIHGPKRDAFDEDSDDSQDEEGDFIDEVGKE